MIAVVFAVKGLPLKPPASFDKGESVTPERLNVVLVAITPSIFVSRKILAKLPHLNQSLIDWQVRALLLYFSQTTGLRVRCEDCHHEKLVAFSCKKRGFCPSCSAKRMTESSALLVDEILPHQPMRQ